MYINKKKQKILLQQSNMLNLNSESLILGTNHGQIILINIINKKIDKIIFNDKETKIINLIENIK